MVSETDIETLCLSAIETHFEANKHVLEFMEICAEKKQVYLVRECKGFLNHLIYWKLRREFNESNEFCFYIENIIQKMLDHLIESRLGPLILKAKS